MAKQLIDLIIGDDVEEIAGQEVRQNDVVVGSFVRSTPNNGGPDQIFMGRLDLEKNWRWRLPVADFTMDGSDPNDPGFSTRWEEI